MGGSRGYAEILREFEKSLYVGLGIMEQMMFENNFCMCIPIHGRVSQDVEGI